LLSEAVSPGIKQKNDNASLQSTGKAIGLFPKSRLGTYLVSQKWQGHKLGVYSPIHISRVFGAGL